MRPRLYLSVRDMAELLSEYVRDPRTGEPTRELNTRKVRRRLRRAGVLVRLPGCDRELYVPTSRVREMYPDAYDEMCVTARWFEDACVHPVTSVELLAPGVKWCRDCGAAKVDGQWRRPAAMLETV